MRTIAVMMQKGGVAKTTTAVNLAHGLAITGRRVLIIDTDTQGQAGISLGLESSQGLGEYLLTDAADIRPFIQPARDNLDIIQGGRPLAGVPGKIMAQVSGQDRFLAKRLSQLNGYDYIVLDTSPGWNKLNIGILFYGQEILAPVSVEALSLNSLLMFFERLTDVHQDGAPAQLRYVLPSFADRRVKKSAEILEQLQRVFGDSADIALCDPVPYSARVSEAAGHGQTVWEYAPKSRGAAAYLELVKRITDDE